MIDWTAIDTVLLDMDGTLLDLHFDNYFWTQHLPAHYARKNQLAEELTIDQLQQQLDIRTGTLQWYCVDHWSACLDINVEDLKRELRHMIKLRPYVWEFLHTLEASPCELILVTNAHRKALDLKMQEVGIEHCFDHLVVSHELKAPKEQQAFWAALQEQHPFDPARTLLIDDTESVLQAAREYGVAHLLTLTQPDSQREMRINTRFPGIHHFDEIMPRVSAQ